MSSVRSIRLLRNFGRGRGSGTSSIGIAGSSSPSRIVLRRRCCAGLRLGDSAAAAARAHPTGTFCNYCGARRDRDGYAPRDSRRSRGRARWRSARRRSPDGLAPILVDMHVGQAELAAVGELEIAHVERVGAAVLAQLRGAHIVAAAASIGIEIVEDAQRRTKFFIDGATSSRTQFATASAIGQRMVAGGHHRDFALIGQDHRCPSAPHRWRRIRRRRPGPAAA